MVHPKLITELHIGLHVGSIFLIKFVNVWGWTQIILFPRFVIVRQFRRLGGDLRRSVFSDMTGDFIFLGLSGHSSCLFVKVRKGTVYLERLRYKISSYIVTDFSVSFNKTSSPLFITMRQLRLLNFNRILDKAETKFFLKFNTASSVMIMTAFDMRPVHARCECLSLKLISRTIPFCLYFSNMVTV